MSVVASAPGKLMLAGEYVVVAAGAPAIATAVDLRLSVRCESGGQGWRVNSPGLGLVDAPGAEVPLLEAVVERFAPAGTSGALSVESALGVGPDKPGLGSSAALVVAASAAVMREFGGTTPPLEELIACHRAGQGGGSGYDVATSLLGGVCLFQSRGGDFSARAVQWPEGLAARVVHFGAGVSSAGQLHKLRSAMERDPEAVGLALDQQCAAAVAVEAGLKSGGAELLSLLAHHERTLIGLDRAARLGIENPAYSGVVERLGSGPAILRTAGAGAGDSAWILAPSDQQLEPALASLTEAGYGLLDLRVGGPGLEIEEER